jgi:hypothetical protein
VDMSGIDTYMQSEIGPSLPPPPPGGGSVGGGGDALPDNTGYPTGAG